MPTCPAKLVDEGMHYLFEAFLAKIKKGPGPRLGPRPTYCGNDPRETPLGKYH
jgi:hypothetical protein